MDGSQLSTENHSIFCRGERAFVDTFSFLAFIHGKTAMALFRAVGLGVAILVLQILAPDIWSATAEFILRLFSLGGDMIRYVASAIASLPPPAP